MNDNLFLNIFFFLRLVFLIIIKIFIKKKTLPDILNLSFFIKLLKKKYDGPIRSKYNAKNITRSTLKKNQNTLTIYQQSHPPISVHPTTSANKGSKLRYRRGYRIKGIYLYSNHKSNMSPKDIKI